MDNQTTLEADKLQQLTKEEEKDGGYLAKNLVTDKFYTNSV